MGKVTSIGLGIVTAFGGFIDMGELITCSQAGSQFRYALLWTVLVGVMGIIIFIDTSGRVAIASGRAIFDVIRERLGMGLGGVSLGIGLVVNLLTLVMEIAGMALVLEIVSGLSYMWWFPLLALSVLSVLWFASFDFIENVFAMLGLSIVVFIVAAVALHPPWGEIARQTVFPVIPEGQDLFLYGFSVVSLLGAFMTPYEIYFYSSGAIEEKWSGKDFITNRMTAFVGMGFGSLIAFAMMIVAAQVLFPHGVQTQLFGTVRLPVESTLGVVGLVFFLIGAFFTTGGAAFEGALSFAYSACQYYGWDWGKNHTPKDAPIFSLWYIIAILAAVLIVFTGIDPVKLTIYTTALAAFSLPFTFIPLFIIANDEAYMGDQRNGRLTNIASIIFLVLLCITTVATIPLFILSGFGGG